ncbi:uncharacterized protein [Taeniopygia guttata]|uniref:uncharacterized protein isoform X2 n=1 Tax=Taeniopygia guttata TaxID=59729 RepID=UPI003BB86BFB
MAEPRPGPPSAPSAPQCSQLHPPSLEGLIPPSHFVLRPRSLGAELEAERGRVQELEAELKALRGRSQCLEAELEAEKGRSRVLAAELSVLRGRGQRLEAELEAEKGRSQILEMELETLRGRGLGPEGAEPSPEQVLLGRWRQKVFQLLLQVRLQRGQELQLQGQVRSLGAAVAAGSRQVSLLELRLRQAEQERQALSQERLRAEAAEEELGKLGQALSRCPPGFWGHWGLLVCTGLYWSVPIAVPRLLGTLGVALADVTMAIGALGTLSERLGRAQHQLRVLVASGRLRWQWEPEGTAGDSSAVAPQVTSEQVTGWHRGDTGGGSVPRLSPSCPPQATKGRDRTRPRPGTVSLAPLVTQLQALGAAILGDIGDPAVPAPLWAHR